MRFLDQLWFCSRFNDLRLVDGSSMYSVFWVLTWTKTGKMSVLGVGLT